MGWGCYRHEVDADSENWKKKIDAMLTIRRRGAHEEPFTWGRDGQVCPFCWEEMEKIQKIYSKALSDILQNPEASNLIATQAFEDAEKIELHPMETE